MMAEEIALAEQYGLYFPVGDTTGAPGLIRGLRSAAVYKTFAEAIADYCPQAWIFNYTNPMSICTRTLTRVMPELKVLGCCHEVFSSQRMLARVASQYLKIEIPPRSEIEVNVLGINHFTWIDQAAYQGHDLLDLLRQHLEQPGTLRTYTQEEVESWNDWFLSTDQVKFTLFQRFGVLAALATAIWWNFYRVVISETLFKWGIIRTRFLAHQRWSLPSNALDVR
jgi:alpha-galactosidase